MAGELSERGRITIFIMRRWSDNDRTLLSTAPFSPKGRGNIILIVNGATNTVF